jgi:hypothetical protein
MHRFSPRDWALPLYDPLTKLLGVDGARKVLLDYASIRSNHRVLDVGCGTGTLVTLIKQLHSDVKLISPDRIRCRDVCLDQRSLERVDAHHAAGWTRRRSETPPSRKFQLPGVDCVVAQMTGGEVYKSSNLQIAEIEGEEDDWNPELIEIQN